MRTPKFLLTLLLLILVGNSAFAQATELKIRALDNEQAELLDLKAQEILECKESIDTPRDGNLNTITMTYCHQDDALRIMNYNESAEGKYVSEEYYLNDGQLFLAIYSSGTLTDDDIDLFEYFYFEDGRMIRYQMDDGSGIEASMDNRSLMKKERQVLTRTIQLLLKQ